MRIKDFRLGQIVYVNHDNVHEPAVVALVGNTVSGMGSIIYLYLCTLSLKTIILNEYDLKTWSVREFDGPQAAEFEVQFIDRAAQFMKHQVEGWLKMANRDSDNVRVLTDPDGDRQAQALHAAQLFLHGIPLNPYGNPITSP